MSSYRLKEGWASVALLVLMLLCLAWSIAAAAWVTGLGVLMWVVVVGGILGIVLAKCRLPAAMSHLLSGMAGLSWSAWLTSRVLAAEMRLPGGEALLELDWRLQAWVADLAAKGQSEVAHIMLLVLCLLLWLVAYVAAWAIFRWQRNWWAVILCGVAMLINVVSSPAHQTLFLLSFLLLALLLIVRTNLAGYEQEWRKDRINYAPDVVTGFLRAGLAVALLALSLAWIVPEVVAGNRFQQAWGKLSEPWRSLQERWESAFQDINERPGPAVFVSRSMAFGGPISLTDRPVMDIKASSGRYWRTRTYDTYMGWGWLSAEADSLLLEANSSDLLEQPEYERREILTQTVTLLEDLGMGRPLTAAGDPLSASIPVQALVSLVTPTLAADAADPRAAVEPLLTSVSLLYSRTGLLAGSAYRITSSTSSVSAEELRGAGVGYPDWVFDRYLQLPESLPSRVRRLAEEQTRGMDSPYDKVVAIEAYLRRFSYSQDIPGPKQGQDGVDYFLFEEKRGYCSYYASSMVVLLRAVGVPARYAEGYSQGRAENGVYRVLEEDSHGWPEVFFPGYGWVEFEPTASQTLTSRSPAVSRTAQASETGLGRRLPQSDDLEKPSLPDRSYAGSQQPQREPFWLRVSGWVWATLGSAAALGGTIAWLVSRNRRRLLSLSSAERAYYYLSRWAGRLLRLRPQEHETPLEHAAAVAAAVPAGRTAVEQIAEMFVAERFGGRDGSSGTAMEAWAQARPILLRRWLEVNSQAVRRLGTRLGVRGGRGRRSPA